MTLPASNIDAHKGFAPRNGKRSRSAQSSNPASQSDLKALKVSLSDVSPPSLISLLAFRQPDISSGPVLFSLPT